MTPATPRDVQTIFDFLQHEGFRPNFDADGDIGFKYQGLSFALCFDESDPSYGVLMLPNIWAITSEIDVLNAQNCVNDVCSKIKMVKGYIRKGKVHMNIEAWLPDREQWVLLLPRAMHTLAHAYGIFGGEMKKVDTPIVVLTESVPDKSAIAHL